ncbi:hypothetical protein BYT27DRAFT_7259806 [Phlegmacium glaucopus]|nr:hypothetical protein BYT27DRAFT_7259806 [Phlegmacium glaucopus]
MLSPSLACDLSIGSKLADFLPTSIVNIALAFSFIAMQPAWNNYFPTGQTKPFTFAMNAIGDLFPSMKPKEILLQVSPTPTIKGRPTSTLQYQPESTSGILYAVALCVVIVLVGAIFTVLRNNTSSPSSSVNVPYDIGSAGETCDNGSSSLDGDIQEDLGTGSNETPVGPSDDPIDPSDNGAESESKLPGGNSNEFVGDIGGSPPPPPPPSFTTSGIDDDSHKKAPGFLAKLKMFLIIFAVLTTLTHGGRITQKIRSLAIHDNFTFSYNNTSVSPYFRQALELVTSKAGHFDSIPATFTRGYTLAPEIVEKFTIIPSSTPSAILQVKSNEIPSSGLSGIFSTSILWSHVSSGSNEKYDSTSIPLPTKDVMSYIPTSPHPIGLSFMAVKRGTPTISSPSKVALALEYIKMFTVFFVFCIFIPILSFIMTILPTVMQLVQLSKSKSIDQRESFTHAADDEAMKLKVDVNEVVLAIEVVENSKVDINIIHDEVVPVSTFVNKGKGKTLETIEEKDETHCPFISKESLDPATPTLSTHTLVGSRRTRPRGPRATRRVKRMRKADKAAIEAALEAGLHF